MKDQLFLLKPGFVTDAGGLFYCGDSVAVEGLLGFFPQLRKLIDVHYLEYEKPREPVASLLGADNQSLPVLILAGQPDGNNGVPSPETSINGNSFYSREQDIRAYLAITHGLPGSS
jgi:hypothetical protein